MSKEITVSVGIRSDNTIDVDILIEEGRTEGEWSFANIDLERAEFLHEELGLAVERLKARLTKNPPKVEVSNVPYLQAPSIIISDEKS